MSELDVYPVKGKLEGMAASSFQKHLCQRLRSWKNPTRMLRRIQYLDESWIITSKSSWAGPLPLLLCYQPNREIWRSQDLS